MSLHISDAISGFLNLNLSDPLYPNTTLYHFAVGVTCPEESFLIRFSVPTGDSTTVSKSFQVAVKDNKSSYILMIFAPAQGIRRYKKGNVTANLIFTKTYFRVLIPT